MVGHTLESVIAWPGMRSEYSWIPAGENPGTTKPRQIGVSFSGHRGAAHQRGSRAGEADIAPGSVFVTAGDPIRWLRVKEPSESLEIYPDPEWIERIAGRKVAVEPAFAVQDAVVLSLASTLRRAHFQRLAIEDLRASSLAHFLIRHLLERFAGLRLDRGSGTRLDPRTLARVVDFMKGALGETLSLERIAAVAAMSPFHFSRAFRRATGLAPHRFLTLLRMERAKALLIEGGTPVSEAARSVGFQNLSHFRRQFRSITGFRPSDLRSPSL